MPSVTYKPSDISIISTGKFANDQLGRRRLSLFNVQQQAYELLIAGADAPEMVFVDAESEIQGIKVVPSLRVSSCHDQSYTLITAKNKGARESRGKILVFTNSDVVFTDTSIQKILRALELHGNPEHFIMQGKRWEVPRYLTALLMGANEGDEFEALLREAERLSIPYSLKKPPSGECIVVPRHIHEALGGFDERIMTYGAEDGDFHKRAKLFMQAEYGDDWAEIICRTIPVLHLHHYAQRPMSQYDRHIETMINYIESGDKKYLNWRKSGDLECQRQ